MSINLEDLNKQQQEAVTTIEGPLMVLAGAGSGKTRVITNRIGYMMSRGISGNTILAITFTNKAANEMRERTQEQYPGCGVTIKTFHSFCALMLRQYISYLDGYSSNFVIIDSDDVKGLIKNILKEIGYDPTEHQPKDIAGAISGAKNRGISAERFKDSAYEYKNQVQAEVYQEYEKIKHQQNMLDFDDLLLITRNLLISKKEVLEILQNRFQYIMVDEYQDTNKVQYDLVNLLASKHKNICVTGDPDQAIYSWRGATIRNILDFEKDYPNAKTVILGKNYRSTKNILGAADSLIKQNSKRKDKELWTDNPAGEKIHIIEARDGLDEARQIVKAIDKHRQDGKSYNDMAIIYRLNSLSRSLEDALVRSGIPYQMVGGLRFYERKEIKDIIAYLRLASNVRDDYSFLRIINAPTRGLGSKFIASLTDFAKSKDLGLFEALQNQLFLDGLSKRIALVAQQFIGILSNVAQQDNVVEAIETVYYETGYIEKLRAKGREEDLTRVENLNELISSAAEFMRENQEASLQSFLEQIALVTDLDNMQDDADVVSLMTMHAVKGLEFPIVFIAAVEKDILPHAMATKGGRDSEEERRLFYVGITRAKQQLYLSYALQRMIYGRTVYAEESPFLAEIDDEFLERSSTNPFMSIPFPGLNTETQETPWADMDGVDAYSSKAMGGDLAKGDMVFHNIFGVGRIINVEGSGERAKVEVQFSSAGRKKLAAPFVKRIT